MHWTQDDGYPILGRVLEKRAMRRLDALGFRRRMSGWQIEMEAV
jgi:hypothetical protein